MCPRGEIRGDGLVEAVAVAMSRMFSCWIRGVYPDVTGRLAASSPPPFPYPPLLSLLLSFPSHGLV